MPLPSCCKISEAACKKLITTVLVALIAIGVIAPLVYVYAIVSKKPDVTDAWEPYSPASGWPHKNLLGAYDRAALQRGFQVYKQVCSTCHSMRLMSYRNLSQLGFNPAEVKALAAEAQVTDPLPNDQGEMFQRPGIPADHFVSPFANDNAARAANGGALPPDLSLIIKAREDHEDYVYSLLTGFGKTPPADEKIATGMQYNPYFKGHQIAMPPPLSDGAVTYADGTKATVPQMASDVVQFLAWASEPTLEERKETGLKAFIFLIVFSGLLYSIKRKIWEKLH